MVIWHIENVELHKLNIYKTNGLVLSVFFFLNLVIMLYLAAGRSSVLRISDCLTGEFHQCGILSNRNAVDCSCRSFTLRRRGLQRDNLLHSNSQLSCASCCFYESADSGCSGADGDNCCRRSHPFPSLFILRDFVVKAVLRTC